jgi:hypothetical protein
LRDQRGFTESDLQVFLEIDPDNIALDVTVREEAIISRSISDRTQQLNGALEMGVLSPAEYMVAMSDELERPITEAQEKQIRFITALVVNIADGEEFQGMSSLSPDIFGLIAHKYMHGLDLHEDDAMERIGRLEMAINTQMQLVQEMQGENQTESQQQEEPGGLPPAQGAPESINSVNSPTGAAGGLPLGLPAAVA